MKMSFNCPYFLLQLAFLNASCLSRPPLTFFLFLSLQFTSFESSLLFTLKSLRSSLFPNECARVSVVVRRRAFCFFDLCFQIRLPFLARLGGRSFRIKSWRRDSISRSSQFIHQKLTNKPIKPPWLDWASGVCIFMTVVINLYFLCNGHHCLLQDFINNKASKAICS